jgi:ABC-2 type transport system ATP-binding protein
MDDIAIKVEHVSKTFKLPHEKQSSLKGSLINFRKRGYEAQQVLDDISFEVKQGEFFGIVGRNGSGKSTLLKLISGIYTQSSGEIAVNGKLTPFIELGVGFNPELTGRENVFLNGALLGFNRKEMLAMYDEIVEFAELGRFMDQKLKNYSSGMQVRLAFSIAIRANTEILVLDEVLAVGDAAFQQKCTDYFEELKDQHKTVILVTHDMESVKRFCSRALLIEDGQIKSMGSPKEIANQYTLDNLNAEKKTRVTPGEGSSKQLSPHINLLEISTDSSGVLTSKDSFDFHISYEIADDFGIELGISVLAKNVSIIEHNTKGVGISQEPKMKHTVHYSLPLKHLNSGRYEVHTAAFEKESFNLIGFNTKSCAFVIDNGGKKRGGILAERGEWKVS